MNILFKTLNIFFRKGGATMQTKSLLISAILLVSILGFISPTVPAFGSTGHATLGVVNSSYIGSASNYSAASSSVGVYAGTSTVAKENGAPFTAFTPAYLAINLSNIVFSGAQFDIYLSTNGFSQISPSDILVAGAFTVSAASGSPSNETATVGAEAGQSYSLGFKSFTSPSPTTGTGDFVEGPMPTNIPGGTYFVKIYDGSSGSVAVSLQELIILPSVQISLPSVSASFAITGPAGGSVTLTGSGFTNGTAHPSNVNITVVNPSGKVLYTKNITADSIGEFTWSATNDSTFKVPDLGLTYTAANPVSGSQGTLAYKGYDYAAGQGARNSTYTEAYRQFTAASAYDPSTGAYVAASGTAPYGNYTSSGTNVNGYVTYPIDIKGNYFNPTSTPTFMFNGHSITPTAMTTINSTGYFAANFTVPIAPKGQTYLTVFDNTGNLTLGVNVQTTLAISPSSGPEGTSVAVNGYGFTASANVTVWWFGLMFTAPVNPASNNELLYNSTVPSTGAFSFTFKVPSNVYGGNHTIFANDTSATHDYSASLFSVTPSFSLSTTTASLGTLTTFSAQGLAVGSTYLHTTDANFNQTNPTGRTQTGATGITYIVSYDNALLSSSLTGNVNGSGTYPVIAAGVPMVHYVGVVYLSPITGTYTALTPIGLNVTGSTTEGAEIISLLQSYQSQTMSQLNTLSSSVSSLSSQVSAGFTSVNSAISALSSKVDTVQSTLGSVQTQTTGIAGVASSLGNATTYLLVAVLLAAIVLVLEIVILVRKK